MDASQRSDASTEGTKEWTYAGANDEERARLHSNKRKRSINIGESNGPYFTEVARWVCSCLAFVKNRFFLCKHLVKQTINTSNGKRRCLLRCRFERRTTPPFLVLNDPDTGDTTSLETQDVAQIAETQVANGFLDSYNVNAEEDPEEKARTYVESNWKLFEQAFKRICSEKDANNWRHVGAMMKWKNSKKPYLMYLSCPEEPRSVEDVMFEENVINE
ncbi:9552_t:CDS:2 [Cetraspora pellucida]|uniref:9552_t:CDS:1 n=1 Tax=Cetraspora pellucida TaxID=1433469 RepID=A0ACA9K7T5_9GLOM|nr:9552_t:CDS:2 [Cetraspora pellucida]